MRKVNAFRRASALGTLASVAAALGASAQQATPAPDTPAAQPQRQRPPRIVRLGVATPGVTKSLDDLKKDAVFPVEGTPDWSVVTKDAVWVSSARANHVVQLLPSTNSVGLIVEITRPCSGLTEAFGSVWAPSCGIQPRTGGQPGGGPGAAPAQPVTPVPAALKRIDPATGKIIASIPADPADSEGGITNGAGSIWMVVKPSKLIRIDPSKNEVIASVDLPPGSENPRFGGGFVWISGYASDQMIKVDPKTNTVVSSTPIGPKPRFITVGDGSVWTLNQGDGSVSRVDMKTGKLVATINCGIQGSGGELAFGEGYVWATMFDFPLTQIDPKTNKVVAQWAGDGGDGMSVGLGSVWLSNLRHATVWRIPAKQ